MWQFTRGYQILQHFAMVFPFFPDGKKHHFPVDFPSLPRCRSRWLLLWGRRPRSPANGKLLYLYRHTFVYLLLSCFIFNLDWIICCLFLIILFIHVSVCLSMCCLYIYMYIYNNWFKLFVCLCFCCLLIIDVCVYVFVYYTNLVYFWGCFLTCAFLSCNANRLEVFDTVVGSHGSYEPCQEKKRGVGLGRAAFCARDRTLLDFGMIQWLLPSGDLT